MRLVNIDDEPFDAAPVAAAREQMTTACSNHVGFGGAATGAADQADCMACSARRQRTPAPARSAD